MEVLNSTGVAPPTELADAVDALLQLSMPPSQTALKELPLTLRMPPQPLSNIIQVKSRTLITRSMSQDHALVDDFTLVPCRRPKRR